MLIKYNNHLVYSVKRSLNTKEFLLGLYIIIHTKKSPSIFQINEFSLYYYSKDLSKTLINYNVFSNKLYIYGSDAYYCKNLERIDVEEYLDFCRTLRDTIDCYIYGKFIKSNAYKI